MARDFWPAAGIAARVRAARRARGWSLREAAQRLGVSVRFLQELEAGKSTARLDKVAQVLRGLGLALEVARAGGGALREEVLARRTLLRTLAGVHGVRTMSLFGSAARGAEEPASDLDFLVELERGRSLLDLLGFEQDLEALFGRRVEVFTTRTLKPRVLARARREMVRIL
jgi:predicted nucleotidyltransferase/lambda repressor-like predicted transcriptional regulator